MNTTARVATVCQNGQFFRSVTENRDYVLGLLRHALQVKPDLVVLPETFTTVSIDGSPSESAETVPGPTTDACAILAKEHRANVVCPIRTNRDGEQRNSAVIIDRHGDVLGIYDKGQPVTTSTDYTVMENGVRPGPMPASVFDLDFGTVGIQICFDVMFAESWQALADQGARLILWPSAYNGGFALQAYAWLHHCYIVSSVRTDKARIIDPLGRVRAETDQRFSMVYEDINLDFAVCHWDFNYSVPEAIVDSYGDRVRISSDRDSAHVLIEPRDPSVTIEGLKREFGFEPSSQYADRHRAAYAELRESRAAPAQRPAHAKRPQYSK